MDTTPWPAPRTMAPNPSVDAASPASCGTEASSPSMFDPPNVYESHTPFAAKSRQAQRDKNIEGYQYDRTPPFYASAHRPTREHQPKPPLPGHNHSTEPTPVYIYTSSQSFVASSYSEGTPVALPPLLQRRHSTQVSTTTTTSSPANTINMAARK